MKTNGFPFLERSIEILIVDDEYSVAAVQAELLNTYRLYNVTTASSAKEAEAYLSSSRRFHVCLFDLGITDINNDEWYLLKKYSLKVSFIVVSGRDSLVEGFKAGVYGARAVIQKPLDFNLPGAFDIINKAFFKSLIIPKNLSRCKQIIKDSVEVLFTRKPNDIKQWASYIDIEARYLRKVWNECFEHPPSHILRLFWFFSQVFSYYDRIYCEKSGTMDEKRDIESIKNEDVEYTNNRIGHFYSKYKKEIKSILG